MIKQNNQEFKFWGEDVEEDKKIMDFLFWEMLNDLEKHEEPNSWDYL